MRIPRRQFLSMTMSAVALHTLLRAARAQAYPARPLRLIVGFPPGGGASIASRIVGQWLSERLGQPVIIENKPGASSNLSVQAAVNSPPDGYTLLYVGASAVVNSSMFETLPFNLLRDIAPVSGMIDFPLVMVVNPSVPAKTVAEFISYAKKNPGKINMASFGTGSTSHVAGELFKSMTGINLVHVPYRGEGAALIDLVGGQVQVMFDILPGCLPHIRSGALRALAMAGKSRIEALPELPTIADTVAGYEANSWGGVGVPRGTSTAVIERLNREINAGLANPAVKSRLAEMSTVPMIFTPAEFGAYMASETEKWAKVVRSANIKPD